MEKSAHTFKVGKWAGWSDSPKLNGRLYHSHRVWTGSFSEIYGKGPFVVFHVINDLDKRVFGHHQLVEIELDKNHFLMLSGDCFIPARKPRSKSRTNGRKTSK